MMPMAMAGAVQKDGAPAPAPPAPPAPPAVAPRVAKIAADMRIAMPDNNSDG